MGMTLKCVNVVFSNIAPSVIHMHLPILSKQLHFAPCLNKSLVSPGQNSSRDYNSSPAVQSSLKGVGRNLGGLGD